MHTAPYTGGGTHYVAKAGLPLLAVFLPPPPEHLDISNFLDEICFPTLSWKMKLSTGNHNKSQMFLKIPLLMVQLTNNIMRIISLGCMSSLLVFQ